MLAIGSVLQSSGTPQLDNSHWVYLQSKNGFSIKDDLTGLRGTAVEKLYSEGNARFKGFEKPGELIRHEEKQNQIPL